VLCGVFGTIWQAQIHAKYRGKTTPFASSDGESKELKNNFNSKEKFEWNRVGNASVMRVWKNHAITR